jgi:hypothetical protein
VAIIGNDKDALLHGLSDFWLRLFEDVGDLQALYRGTEFLLGQAYLHLLSDVLNASIVETPLFRQEYFHSIVIPEDELVQGSGDFPWTFTADLSFGRIPILQNKVFSPSAELEEAIDFVVDGNAIHFKANPFDPLVPGFAFREIGGRRQLSFWAVDARVDDLDLYYRFGHFFSDQRRSSEAYRMFLRGLMQLYLLGPAIERIESALNVVCGLPVVRDDGEIFESYDSGAELQGTDGFLSGTTFHSDDTEFGPTAVGGYLHVVATGEIANRNTYPVRAVSADGHTLTLGAPQGASSWPGFTTELGASWEFSWSDKATILTDRNLYTFPRQIPLRTDLLPGQTLRAFEPLSTAVEVTDYLSDPEWWLDAEIPAELLPGVPSRYRVASPKLAVGRIGCNDDTGFARIGDPEFRVGPALGFSWNAKLQSYVDAALARATPLPSYRNRAAFILMDRFLKLHLFAVSVHPSIETTGVLISDMRDLIDEVKPTHTKRLHFETNLDLTEPIVLGDPFAFRGRPIPYDTLEVTSNRWKIGELRVGTRFTYGPAGAVDLPTDGSGTALVVGGANPTAAPRSQGLLDLPLVLRTRSVP